MSVSNHVKSPHMFTLRSSSSIRIATFRNVGLHKRLAVSHQYVVRACAHHTDDHSATHSNFTVTTPLYYANAAPHMGSAYPTIAADILARFNRLQGKRVSFITGTDEHGEKIALAAANRGMSPKEHCDDIVDSYKRLWNKLDISYDSFIRTTDPKHEALVKTVLDRVWNKGDIYKATYEGYYCVDCEEYKDLADMDEAKNCPIHQKPCTKRQEENYFFALSKYQHQLEQLLIDNPHFITPEKRKNEVLGWIKEGVRDFSISRAAVQWGIPLPRDPSQTVYVWFDALNGYLSGLYRPSTPMHMLTGNHSTGQETDPAPSSSSESSTGDNGEELVKAAGRADADELSSLGWPANVHIIGKDILRFHAVYWPAMLMSADLPVPQKVFGHGFLTKDGLKMGKSLGNVLDPDALVDGYGADAVRYYFMREVSFGQDGDFSEERFRNIVNANLANDIGNLLNRTLTLLSKNCDGKIPIDTGSLPQSHPLRSLAGTQPQAVAGAFEQMKFHEACESALMLSSRGNVYLDEMAPWTAFKKGDDAAKAEAGAALAAVLEAVRIVAVMLIPVTPSLSRKIYGQLGFADGIVDQVNWERDTQWGGLTKGHSTPVPSPVFTRLDGDYVTEVTGGTSDEKKEKKNKKEKSEKKAKTPAV